MSSVVPTLKRVTPWWVKIGVKVPMSRLPIDAAGWRRIGIFKLGRMMEPDVARQRLTEHLERVGRLDTEPFTLLELGPGDSLLTGLIAGSEFGATSTVLIDVGKFATTELEFYRSVGSEIGIDVDRYDTFDELLADQHCTYLTDGLESLRTIPDESIDVVVSNAVLEHVRRAEFAAMVRETFRVLAPGGVTTHFVDFEDHLAKALNSLRFSERVWESDLMANSGFYTNRLRYSEVLDAFRDAGFEITAAEELRWPSLPTPRASLNEQFQDLPDDELLVRGVYLSAIKPSRAESGG